MTPREHFDGARNDAFLKGVAIKIQDKLRELRQNDPEVNARRWCWELLQNAKDAAHDRVRIEYCLERGPVNRLIVRHSGRPFQPEDLLYLIAQTSSKERPLNGTQPKTTGRYGTGFITTHLLSPVADVSGLLETPGEQYRQFKISLDRSGRTIDELIAGLERALSIRDDLDSLPIVERIDTTALNTSFIYELAGSGLDTVTAGLSDLKRSLPLTLAFTSEIHEVALLHEQRTYHVASREEIGNSISIVTVVEQYPRGQHTHRFALASGERSTLAAHVDSPSDTPLVRPFDLGTPRLFCDFPLVGSETFPVPLVANSAYFYPNDARSGLYLEDDTDEAAQQNRVVLEELPGLLNAMMSVATDAGWADRCHLAGFAAPIELTPKAKDWYTKSILLPVRSQLLHMPIVETICDESRSLRKPLVPGGDNTPLVWLPRDPNPEVCEGIWRLGQNLPSIRAMLPKKEHVQVWNRIGWDDCGLFQVGVLVKQVSRSENLEALAQRMTISKNEAVVWLNDLVMFLTESGNADFLSKHKTREQCIQPDGRYGWKQSGLRQTPILPNQQQAGTFRLKSELFLDEGIDEALKDVAADLGTDFRVFLLDSRISLQVDEPLRVKTSKDIAHSIENAVRNKIKQANKDESTHRAFRTLYRWMDENESLAQTLFSGLFEDRHILIPPEEAAMLIRQAERVPGLERENASLKAMQINLENDHHRLQTENQKLQEEIAILRQTADSSKKTQSIEDAEARQKAHHYIETWEAIKAALETLGTARSRRTATDLSRLLAERPELFNHVSEASVDAYTRWLGMLERAKARVREHLEEHPDYDGEWDDDPHFPTLVTGVRRHGRDIRLVVRPADGGFIVLYEQIERDVLEQADSELWIEGDGNDPERLTLGKLANRLGIDRFPLRVPVGRSVVIHIN